jgi:8-oxo-dGTP pyrophosphatase MutT (NUDIX family)
MAVREPHRHSFAGSGKAMQAWKTRSRRIVLDEKPWLVVEHHQVELPDGRLIPNWHWVITPDYVNVIAVTEKNEFLCFRQVKYAIEGPTLGIIGGYINAGEEPLAAAQRELREETGYEAPLWTELGHYRVDPNRGIAMGHLYLAQAARWTGGTITDDLEEQKLLLLSQEEIEAALQNGEIKVLAWAAAVAFALRHLHKPTQ